MTIWRTTWEAWGHRPERVDHLTEQAANEHAAELARAGLRAFVYPVEVDAA